ncbi:MAG: glycogen-debranching protein [Propionibacterium sp.]|nr:glycogen-debranching protein [Propionibacterium sp.]
MPETSLQAVDSESWSEADWPLGALWDAESETTTVAVHAPNATRVLLEIYPEAIGADASSEADLQLGENGIWRGRFTGMGPGTLYGFRCWGANWPVDEAWQRGNSAAGFISDLTEDGDRFNPNKVLFDPYTRELTHNLESSAIEDAGLDAGAFGTGGQDYHGRPRREYDTGRIVPKGIVLADDTDTGRRPMLRSQDQMVYEAHLRNLTAHPSTMKLHDLIGEVPGFQDVVNVPEELLGTYAGAALMAPYLRALGVNTIEFLPVQETNDAENTEESGGTNHWAYQTLAYFAPNRQYAADKSPGGPTREFKEMVRAFHDADVEVWIDVVFNHTGEGGNWGDVDTAGFVSLGGFAAADTYVMTAEHGIVDGATGSSNQVNFSRGSTRQLVLDSLAYWADEMGVDGFRFDLATVLGRKPDNADREDWDAQKQFFNDHPLLVAIRDLADEKHVSVVAEAWDLWGYEVGNFPAGWGEWNGRYRDVLRRFAKGEGNTHEFMDMINGDWLNFNDQGGPQKSINFVTAHDGFTMMDLVSFNTKDNLQPFPFGPSDGGSDDNLSWDSGGDKGLRRTRWRNFWTLLFFSRGVPMVVSGDEYGRSQNGNNNPWCLDTIGFWNNWEQAASNAPGKLPVDPDGKYSYYDILGTMDAPEGVNPLLGFAARVARLRRDQSALRVARWGDAVLGNSDVTYLFAGLDGKEGPAEGQRAVAFLVDGQGMGADSFLVLVNMDAVPHRFTLPVSGVWWQVIDTGPWAEADGNWWPVGTHKVEGSYEVHAWSVAVLQAPPMANENHHKIEDTTDTEDEVRRAEREALEQEQAEQDGEPEAEAEAETEATE